MGTAVSATESSEIQDLIDRLPFDKKAGDYFDKIKKFPANTVARWRKFPVRLRIPDKTPAVWKESITSAVERWKKYFPIENAGRTESSDLEISWVNHLPPRVLAITRLTAFDGNIKVKIFLLRPAYYVPGLDERALSGIVLHEMGHALGIFGHSTNHKDTMYITQLVSEDGRLSNGSLKKIGARDLNTLRRIYRSPALPEKFSTRKPHEWTTSFSEIESSI